MSRDDPSGDESFEVRNMRPSYLNFEDSCLGPNTASFDPQTLARKLSGDFLLEADDEKIRTFLRIRPQSTKKTKNATTELSRDPRPVS